MAVKGLLMFVDVGFLSVQKDGCEDSGRKTLIHFFAISTSKI